MNTQEERAPSSPKSLSPCSPRRLASALGWFPCFTPDGQDEQTVSEQTGLLEWGDSIRNEVKGACKLPLHEVEIVRVISDGPVTVVHQGHYQGRPVAVKMYSFEKDHAHDDDRQKRMQCQREILLWQNLQHPNVLQFVGANARLIREPASTLKEEWALVSEYMPGGSLQHFLKSQENQKLSLSQILSLALDIARGMEYLHSNNILHRDLKSANLLIDENEQAKVGDFGCSSILCQKSEVNVGQSDAGSLCWMAPEVMLGDPHTWKSDVYSYGIVLWELCTCKLPYEGESLVSLMHTVPIEDHRPPTEGLPPVLVNIMQTCWRKDPSERPDFSDILRTLEQYFPMVAKSGSPPSRISPPISTRRIEIS